MNAPSSPVPPGGPLRGPAPVQGPATGATRGAGVSGDGAAFRALLEELEQRAGALEEKSRSDLQPGDLPEAVDQARTSMQDALKLSTELLEAWRQSQHQGGAGTPGSTP